MEIMQDRSELRFTPNVISFLADVLVLLRYCESGGRSRKKVMTVAQMHGSQHSKAFREYDIAEHGFEIGEGSTGSTGASAARRFSPPTDPTRGAATRCASASEWTPGRRPS